MSTFIPILLWIVILMIPFLKRKYQLGQTWDKDFQTEVYIKNKKLQCSHCGNDKFSKREGLLNTTWVSFFRFGWLNYSASCFVCQNCGLIKWFVKPKEKINTSLNSEDYHG